MRSLQFARCQDLTLAFATSSLEQDFFVFVFVFVFYFFIKKNCEVFGHERSLG